MTTFILFLVYIGGVEDGRGFWKAVFWPYFLGEKLSRWAFDENTFQPAAKADAQAKEAQSNPEKEQVQSK